MSRRTTHVFATAVYVACAAAAAYAQWVWSTYHTQDTLASPPMAAESVAFEPRRPHRPKHVIVVVEENSSPQRIFGDPAASFITMLATRGAVFARAQGVAHPSQPNYLALFAGRTNPDADRCPPGLARDTPSLGGQLRRAGLSFAGYAEGLPYVGFTGCAAGDAARGYVRKHAPWTDFADVPASAGKPLRGLPPLSHMEAVAFVIPDLGHDMHNGSVAEGDAWLREHIGPLIPHLDAEDAWLIIVFDESDRAYPNDIPLIVVGSGVRPGERDEPVTHYDVLRTIEDAFGLPPLGGAAGARGLAL